MVLVSSCHDNLYDAVCWFPPSRAKSHWPHDCKNEGADLICLQEVADRTAQAVHARLGTGWGAFAKHDLMFLWNLQRVQLRGQPQWHELVHARNRFGFLTVARVFMIKRESNVRM